MCRYSIKRQLATNGFAPSPEVVAGAEEVPLANEPFSGGRGRSALVAARLQRLTKPHVARGSTTAARRLIGFCRSQSSPRRQRAAMSLFRGAAVEEAVAAGALQIVLASAAVGPARGRRPV